MSRPLLLLALALAGCSRGREVAVRVSVTGPDSADSPVAGVVLTAVPFDRDSLLHALASRATTAPPDTSGLDSLLRSYQAPFAALTSASRDAAALRDSVAAGGSAAVRLGAALTAAQARETEARRRIDAAQAANAVRLDSIRRRMATWENSTYANYESIATRRLKATGRALGGDTTGADGWARVRLPAGDWWIYATSWDVSDPNRYWYWNVHVGGDTLRFDPRNGARRPRF